MINVMRKNESKDKSAYCLYCDCDVNYYIDETIEEKNVKGQKVLVPIKHAFCANCGNPVFVYELEKENQIKTYDAYKQRKGLLTSEEIVAIRKKYKLSQTKLARLIKVGDKNIARYESGAIQDSSIDLLIRLLDEVPKMFGLKVDEQIIETNKSIVIVCSTYDISFDSAEENQIYRNKNLYIGGESYDRIKVA